MNIFTDKKNYDIDLDNIKIESNDFNYVNKDKKIHDEKFASKPTTFLKDAFRRFLKNKSSVVAAVILGILILLAIFVPIISDSNISSPSVKEAYLAPKLFESGTGFWDGTKKYTHIVYDTENEVPANFYKNAVTNIEIEPVSYTNQANAYGKGGYFVFTTDLKENEAGYYYCRSSKTTYTSSGNYMLSLIFGTDEGVNGNKLGEYSIYLVNSAGTVEICLKDWSTDYSEFDIDISAAIANAGETKVANGQIEFRLKYNSEYSSYILIKTAIITSSDSNEDVASISINDATQSVLYAKDDTTQQFPLGYWTSNGIKNVYQSEIYYCSFRYDTYIAAYDMTTKTVAISDLKKYKDNGWCDYDDTDADTLMETFVVLDSENCPIETIESVKLNTRTHKIQEVTAGVYRYRQYGYSSMPKFLFGTDSFGYDIFKKAFAGLRTSLILGVCTAAVCFLFGLCWGAISGYFGGTVDLVMERFCDILGGIPWIVVMTLAILHFGNNFITFFMALCLTGWMGTAARTRTQFYRFKGREYVLASRTLGASDFRLIFRHILPNSLGTIVTSSVLMIPSVIFSEASLAYLNLGLQGLDSFGVMLSDNQQYISSYPNLIVFPSAILALMMISFNLFGNGLRDALNPSLKGGE